MSRNPNQNKPVLINGCLCKIQINKTDGNEWKLENANLQTIRIIDKLLHNKENDFKFDNGITIINPLNTFDLNLIVTRPSNHIGIIRAFVGSNTLLTYHKPQNFPFYGVIKSAENIAKLEKLKANILEVISNKKSA